MRLYRSKFTVSSSTVSSKVCTPSSSHCTSRLILSHHQRSHMAGSCLVGLSMHACPVSEHIPRRSVSLSLPSRLSGLLTPPSSIRTMTKNPLSSAVIIALSICVFCFGVSTILFIGFGDITYVIPSQLPVVC